MAFRKTGGKEEWGISFAPTNVAAPEGSTNDDGKVMCAVEPKVSMAQLPTVA